MRSIQLSRLAGARPASKCAPASPQLCTPVLWPPDGDDWLHEIKWDGFRMLCRIEDGEVVLSTRNGFELVALRPDGSSTFNAFRPHCEAASPAP